MNINDKSKLKKNILKERERGEERELDEKKVIRKMDRKRKRTCKSKIIIITIYIF